MNKRSFPYAYIGSTRSSLDFGNARGSRRWELEHVHAIHMHEQSVAELQEPAGSNPLRAQALFSNQLDLGLHYAWDGDPSKARDLLRASAMLVEEYILNVLPALTSGRAPNLARIARDGAAAASLADEQALAQRLFGYAERFAAALVTAEEAHPAEPTASLQPWGTYPLIRAYSLLRARRLDGFSACLFEVPFPEAKNAMPAWQPANIEALLRTVETSVAVGRARREVLVWWNSEKYLLPLLHALAESLRDPDSASARVATQTALEKYFSMIRNLADFLTTYLLALDIQKAFPEILKPVIPSVL